VETGTSFYLQINQDDYYDGDGYTNLTYNFTMNDGTTLVSWIQQDIPSLTLSGYGTAAEHGEYNT
jgi:hypothetical protein